MAKRSPQQVVVAVTGVMAAAAVGAAVADVQRTPGPVVLAAHGAVSTAIADRLRLVSPHADHGHGLTRGAGRSPSGGGG